MEKFNDGKPFTLIKTGEYYIEAHGRDTCNKFTLCPYGKSHSLPFCDGCGQTKAKPQK